MDEVPGAAAKLMHGYAAMDRAEALDMIEVNPVSRGVLKIHGKQPKAQHHRALP